MVPWFVSIPLACNGRRRWHCGQCAKVRLATKCSRQSLGARCEGEWMEGVSAMKSALAPSAATDHVRVPLTYRQVQAQFVVHQAGNLAKEVVERAHFDRETFR